jgi:hypothetical protein
LDAVREPTPQFGRGDDVDLEGDEGVVKLFLYLMNHALGHVGIDPEIVIGIPTGATTCSRPKQVDTDPRW